MPSSVTALVQRLVDRVAAAEPVVATQLGMAEHADELPDLSPPALDAYLSDARRLGERLDEAAAGAADDAAAIDAVTGGQIARRVVRAYGMRGVQRARPGLYLDAAYGVLLLMIKEIGSPDERVAALRGRLAALPGVLEEGLANLRGPLPRAYVMAALDDVPGVAELVGEAALRAAAELGWPGALDDVAAPAAAAVARFAAELRRRFLDDATPEVAGGRELLVDLLTHEHLLLETPEEIAAVGRAAVADTRAAMAELAAAMGHDSTAAAVAAVQADRPAREELLGSYREALAAARRFVVEHDLVTLPPGEELVVEPTPRALRGSLPFAAYEGAGPFDRVQRGFYWVTEPPADLVGDDLARALASHPFASMPTVGVHEAYPGHHTQFSRANRAATLARRVAFIPDGGMLLIEGWAFYCEEMMEAAGFLAAPAVRLMRLNDQLWRACRVVIDMELNLGLMGFDEAVDFLSREAHLERSKAALEVRWYVAVPGYPMAYFIGKREIAALARDFARRHSPSLRAFHDELLEWGATTPALIRRGMGLVQPGVTTSRA
jgi:uncharacterized protein (DUF885 family)